MIPNSPEWEYLDAEPNEYLGLDEIQPDNLIGVGVQAVKSGPYVLELSEGSINDRWWLMYQYEGTVVIRPSDGILWGDYIELFIETGTISEIDFTFDQLGRPITVYLVDDQLYLNWYDPIAEEQTSTNLGIATSCAAGFDYVNDTSNPDSDAMIAYVREDTLYWRLQRERWVTEYSPPVSAEGLIVDSMGFTRDNRFQIIYRSYAKFGESPYNVSAPVISGDIYEGGIITCTAGSWTGLDPITYLYVWTRDNISIPTASGLFYTVTEDDLGHEIQCLETAYNSLGSNSAASNYLSIATSPINNTLPSISGEAYLYGTLTCVGGEWSGTEPISYSYEWIIEDSVVGTGKVYLVSIDDVGKTIVCLEYATNAVGVETASSNSITISTEYAPVNIEPPVISSTDDPLYAGGVVVTTDGEWQGSEPLTISYTWLVGGHAVSTNSNQYTTTSGDTGSSVSCAVSASNSEGEETETSNSILVDDNTIESGEGDVGLPSTSYVDSETVIGSDNVAVAAYVRLAYNIGGNTGATVGSSTVFNDYLFAGGEASDYSVKVDMDADAEDDLSSLSSPVGAYISLGSSAVAWIYSVASLASEIPTYRDYSGYWTISLLHNATNVIVTKTNFLVRAQIERVDA